MSYEVHREEYRGHTIRIINDESCGNPRKEYDHLATLITWERNHISPDSRRELRDLDDFLEWYDEHPAIVLGVTRYHEGEYDTCDFDREGEYEGVAYILADDAVREWPVAVAWERARECIDAEVAEYSDWATGNVWGYEIGDPENDRGPIDSCWGFIGDWGDYVLEEARRTVDHIVEADEHEKRVIDAA